ncbi:hypothetical protein J5N97_027586 [Dioscorea zingiberensis]|uniref:BHLH domain-containing protein n=1 Tax=Dioscorea zingiberensis TaxID=325984 RepID=A0A9D5C542_9LILI|nr:hypothetical protein J5N97_027586 [Dioscorea zingiberensis]
MPLSSFYSFKQSSVESGVRKSPPPELDSLDCDGWCDYDCESEEGAEFAEEQVKSVPLRPSGGSKRSRAAEVHNLSEKRRRSRINEKMKALQNLIPNSNKTDKASMLDEAIEYLKQLQLQVQMLSMRNGLNLHPMYLPGNLQLMQTSQMSIDFTIDGGSATNMGVGSMLPPNQNSLQQHPSDILNQSASCYQSLIVPNSTNINNLGCTFHESFQLPIADEFKEEMEAQQQSNMRNLTKKLSSENEDEICGGDY